MKIESLFVGISIGFVASLRDYCDPKLCKSGFQHIGCGNVGNFSSVCPEDSRVINLNESEIELILKNHNRVRNRIAKGIEVGFLPASRMASMTWSFELAELAEMNVKQCKMLHDSCRSTAEFNYAGQNIAYRASFGTFEPVDSVIENVVQSWYAEVINAAQSDIDKCCTSKSGKVIGHFTQLVTDRATQVGCAILRFSDKQFKSSLMTCNYAFTNINGMKVYVSGNSASGCVSGKNFEFPALCSVDELIKASP